MFLEFHAKHTSIIILIQILSAHYSNYWTFLCFRQWYAHYWDHWELCNLVWQVPYKCLQGFIKKSWYLLFILFYQWQASHSHKSGHNFMIFFCLWNIFSGLLTICLIYIHVKLFRQYNRYIYNLKSITKLLKAFHIHRYITYSQTHPHKHT